MRKQLLLQKKSAAEEEAEARKYLQLREQYVYILLYLFLFYLYKILCGDYSLFHDRDKMLLIYR